MTIPVKNFPLNGGKQQSYHFNNGDAANPGGLPLTLETLNGNHVFIPSETLDMHIHVARCEMAGANGVWNSTENGVIYWWQDATRFTLKLNLFQNSAREKEMVFTDENPWVIKAGDWLCLRWNMSYPQSGYRYPFGDLLFTMHTPPV